MNNSPKIYNISKIAWELNDRPNAYKYLSEEEFNAHRQSMLFHVKEGDYLSTLATVLRFFEESIRAEKISPEMRTKQLETIEILMSDLLYLGDNFDIVPKKGNKSSN